MSKEIGKLLKLLNEYEGQETWSYDEEMGMPYYGWGDDCDYEAYLISKKYGFIEWLVQNLKINVDELRKHGYITKTYDLDEPGEGYSYLDWLLMLLAIQDEPINFLISILK